jgi:hypothetical protein
MEVAKEVPEDYEGFYAQRPVPLAGPEGELLVVSFDGKGIPMIKEESACVSVVKHRMEGEGKRWSLAGAEAILALRSLKKSHDNDLRDD